MPQQNKKKEEHNQLPGPADYSPKFKKYSDHT